MRGSRSGFPRNPRKYQGGWITAVIAGISLLAGQRANRQARNDVNYDRNREAALQSSELDLARKQDERSNELFEHYQQTFMPAEKALVRDAFGNEISPARAEARATADVRNAIGNARAISDRRLRADGVNPASGAHVSSERALALGEAALEAGSRTRARETTRDRNFARQLDVTQMGRGLPATAGNLSAMAQQGVSSVSGRASAMARNSEGLAYDTGVDYGASMVELANELYDVFSNSRKPSKGGKKPVSPSPGKQPAMAL